jgi:DNA-binding transcriptional LysR family regulator
MNLKDVDLSLLVVLSTLVEFRSVSRTAAEMNLSQSATSHALRRLRRMFDDELLVRRDGMMQPTPAALRFTEVLRPALTQVATLLDERRSFDPRTSTRPFVLRCRIMWRRPCSRRDARDCVPRRRASS